MTPEQLKASILQLAIQGRLVEQLASERLSESIVMKALDRNCEDMPFEIPDKWCWCHLEDIATLHNGRAYKKAEMLKTGKYPLLRVGNLFTSDTWYYSDMELEPEKYCDNGDLLYAWSASFGPHIWNGGKVIYHYHIWKVELRYPQMRDYLYWVLAAQTNAIKRRGHGLTMIHITKAGTEKMLIPVPPFNEQKRIVAKIEELLPYIDRYAVAYEKLEQFNAKFPEDMKKSILQYAIQGKLVEQRAEEGTGEELYRQIQEEKKRLIKIGKLKKTRALSTITDEEIPFDFPSSWKVCYIDDIAFVTKLAGFEYTKYIADNLVPDGIPLFKGKNVQNGKLVLSFESYIPESISDELPRSQITKKCLLTPYVGTIGNIAVFDGSFKAHLGSNVGKIELLNSDSQTFVLEEYVLWYLKSTYGYAELTKYKKATAQESISIDAIRNVVIAIPPLEEQHRIVAKLEEILPLCERLR